MDRLIVELKLLPETAYAKIRFFFFVLLQLTRFYLLSLFLRYVIESVNSIITNVRRSLIEVATSSSAYSSKASDPTTTFPFSPSSAALAAASSNFLLSPVLGNVLFSSASHSYLFTLDSFARLYLKYEFQKETFSVLIICYVCLYN
jgi:hypothetical protein